jgi:hypothetical protein
MIGTRERIHLQGTDVSPVTCSERERQRDRQRQTETERGDGNREERSCNYIGSPLVVLSHCLDDVNVRAWLHRVIEKQISCIIIPKIDIVLLTLTRLFGIGLILLRRGSEERQRSSLSEDLLLIFLM